MQLKKSLLAYRNARSRKGSLSGIALGVVIAIVAMFIGLFMISKVSDITAINNTSSLYSTYTKLQTNTGTIYDVLILVVIVVALGVAIYSIRGFAGGGENIPGGGAAY